jgi:hypothetical protein
MLRLPRVALKNMNGMFDVELILGMLYTLSLFECVHMLIKIAQSRDVFVHFCRECQINTT